VSIHDLSAGGTGGGAGGKGDGGGGRGGWGPGGGGGGPGGGIGTVLQALPSQLHHFGQVFLLPNVEHGWRGTTIEETALSDGDGWFGPAFK